MPLYECLLTKRRAKRRMCLLQQQIVDKNRQFDEEVRGVMWR